MLWLETGCFLAIFSFSTGKADGSTAKVSSKLLKNDFCTLIFLMNFNEFEDNFMFACNLLGKISLFYYELNILSPSS